MNLDITQRYLRREKESEHFQKKRNNSSIKKRKCYNCDVKEHYTNKCRKLRKLQQVAKIKKKLKQWRQKLAIVLTVSFRKHEHDCLSWMICYNNMCTTY